MADDLLNNVLGADYQEVNAVESGNAVYKNGKLQYFKIDIDQPGKYFFDLTDAFNATVDESNKIIPLQFVRGGQPIQLNGFQISMDGKYPDMATGFSVTGKLNTSSPAFMNFVLPLGMFQAVGPYRFQFTITNSNTGEVLKSPYQFFNVTESATNLAIDLNKGIEPYDSEYQNWKDKVEAEINSELKMLNNLSESADQLKALMNQYVADAEGHVESQFTKCLQQENTWTAKQHFNGGITFSGNAQGDTLVANQVNTTNLTVIGNTQLPAETSVNGLFKLENSLRKAEIDGGISTMLNATGQLNPMSGNNSSFWCWGERYEVSSDVNAWPHFFFYFLFKMSCNDVGKPIAQFKYNEFLKGANEGPVTIPMDSGSAYFHLDSNSNCIYLDGVSGISGDVWVRAKFWV